MNILGFIIVGIILVAGCYFVNDTKSKHGTCCGKGCAGCKVYNKNKKG